MFGGALGQPGVEVDETDIDVPSRKRRGIQVVKNCIAVGVGILTGYVWGKDSVKNRSEAISKILESL